MMRNLAAFAVIMSLAGLSVHDALGQGGEEAVGMPPMQDGTLGPGAFAPYQTPDLNLDTDQPVTRDRRGAVGVVTSRALHKMPEGFPVSVYTYDDSDINLEIRGLLIEALEQRGLIVAEGAPLELSFKSQVIQAVLAERAPSFGEIKSSSGESVGNKGQEAGVEVNMNLWSSTRDSLLGGRHPSSAKNRSPRFHINAVVRDLDSGRVVWQADAISEMVTRNQSRIVRSMVGPLAASFGETVNQEPFDLK